MDRFPEECALLVQQAREYRNSKIDSVLQKHVSKYDKPSFLSAGVMMQLEARETWHAVLRELGFES